MKTAITGVHGVGAQVAGKTASAIIDLLQLGGGEFQLADAGDDQFQQR